MNPALMQLLSTLLRSFIIPFAILAAVIKTMTALVEYIKTLQVIGKADEWVLIIANGVCKRAEVGLSCFKGPYDQVVKFPSTSQMVTFESEQVTSEMNGVNIKGMVIWKINSFLDNGPFKAYTTLGADL
jgi:hypothetical protein